MKENAIRINPADNVAVVTVDLKPGQPIIWADGGELTATTDIPRNHKAALSDIPEDAPVIKYGETIALASGPIKRGDWVHNHNLKSRQG